MTGAIDEKGRVVGVGKIEEKVEIALSCGFQRIVIPSEDLEQGPSWMRKDGRIHGVTGIDDLRDWLRESDPQVAGRGKMYHFARGIISGSAMPGLKPIRELLAEDLAGEKWALTFKTLRRIVRESRRGGRVGRWTTMLAGFRQAFIEIVQENRQGKIPRKIWFGMFCALLPESVVLLHVPLLLEQYGHSERVLSDRLYARFGHRLVDQELNLSQALEWGRELFRDPAASPWFDPAFRKRYPHLCWFLFSDPFEALSLLLSWPEPTAEEHRWRRRIMRGLEKIDAERLAKPEKRNGRIVRKILARAAGTELEGFFPDPVNLLPIDRRPAKMLELLVMHGKRLDPFESETLRNHLSAHIRSRDPGPEDRTRLEGLLAAIDDPVIRKQIGAACRKSTLQMIRRCGDVLWKQESARGRPSPSPGDRHPWPVLLANAWRRKPGDGDQRARIRNLDITLNHSLLQMLEGKPGTADEAVFPVFTNPALHLARLVLARRSSPGGFDWTGRLNEWLDLLVAQDGTGTGFRQKLIRECLLHWAGRLAGLGLLPEPADDRVRMIGPGFRLGLASARGRLDQGLIGMMGKGISRGSPDVLPWLPWVAACADRNARREIGQAIRCLREQLAAESAGEKRDSLVLSLIMCRAAFPGWDPSPEIAWPKDAAARAREFRLRPHQARVTDQGLFPLRAVWKKDGDGSGCVAPAPGASRRCASERIVLRLAESRGFSPLALAYQKLFFPKGQPDFERPGSLREILGPKRLWALEWEAEIFHTILVFELWYRKQIRLQRRMFLGERLGFLNGCLCGDLLGDLEAGEGEA